MESKTTIKVKLNTKQPNTSQELYKDSIDLKTEEIVEEEKPSTDSTGDWNILDLDAFIEDCNANGINVYGTFSQLKYGTDILLATEDETVFLNFCVDNGINTAFYYMDFPSVSDATVDFEYIREFLTKEFERRVSLYKYRYPNLPADYFDSALDSVLEKAARDIAAQNSISENLNEDEPYVIELFCVLGAIKVGIILGEEEHALDDIKTEKELFNEYSLEMNNSIDSLAEAAFEENELIQKQKVEDYNHALSEIEEFLMDDPKLMTMKFKNSRQDYADKLRMEWGQKINQTITQKDVKAIIERVYISRKEI